MTPPTTPPLIWLDMEMTGLDPERDCILEVACVITDGELNVLAEGPSLAIWQPDPVLGGMDAWNVSHHTRSGLVDAVRKSRTDTASAESQTLDFLRRHTDVGESPLCGNSICQDRRFMARHMPELEAHFHYRLVDVSTLTELVKRWRPDLASRKPDKQSLHRAMDDVRESIAELAWYRSHLFPTSVAGSRAATK